MTVSYTFTGVVKFSKQNKKKVSNASLKLNKCKIAMEGNRF